jgi:predicted RNA-binding Zn ribbon-like protein
MPASDPYPGPARDEPIAIELHNTLYAVQGGTVDGLADAAAVRAWLFAVGDRLPAEALRGRRYEAERFFELRGAVGEALRSAAGGYAVPRAAVEVLNAASGRCPVSPRLLGAGFELGLDYGDADPGDIALGTIATDAIDLLSGPLREEICTCDAPGCVLMFVKDHPRRSWCSVACGNRARQARYYARQRAG